MTAPAYRVVQSSLGTLHQHECAGCKTTFATYPGGFPRRWKVVNGKPACPSCARAMARAARRVGRLQ